MKELTIGDIKKRLLDDSEEAVFAYEQECFILDVTRAIWDEIDNSSISQADFARKLGVSRPRVSKILEGYQNLTLKTLFKIAGIFTKKPKLVFCSVEAYSKWNDPVKIDNYLHLGKYSTQVVENQVNQNSVWKVASRKAVNSSHEDIAA